MSKHWIRASMLAATAAVGIGLSAGPASAASWNAVYQGYAGGENYLVYYGSSLRATSAASTSGSFTLRDNAADGYGSKLTWSGGGKSGSCVNEKGKGESVTCSTGLKNTAVSYRFCVKDGSTMLACWSDGLVM